jgi:hypothetical protein
VYEFLALTICLLVLWCLQSKRRWLMVVAASALLNLFFTILSLAIWKAIR